MAWRSTKENAGFCTCDGDKWLESSSAERDLWMLVNSRLNKSLRCALAAKRANCILGCTKRSTASKPREVIIPLCLALVWPHLGYCVQFWAPQYSPIRRGWERLRCLVWRRGGREATSQLSAASWGGEAQSEVPASAPWEVMTGCTGTAQSYQEWFRLDIRRNFLTVRVVKHWDRFPREVADAPWLSVFKRLLDDALNN